ncbi:DUF4143 domain-containing protein [Pseudarcicella hirudinis]|uniref:DUF4143 domain-containing protein n=1 Tax=Pseudarcicella hirudinis TaxID=1079859 RepID=UPI0035E72AE2
MSTEITRKLLEMLSHLNGNLVNMNDLSRSLGVSSPTINRYLDLLEGSFIIQRLQPYHVNITKRLVKSPKIYFRDSGILHQLARVISYDQLLQNPIVGASWEGYVIEQIKRNLGYDWQLFFYRTQVGAEVDLVMISPTGKKIFVEIKLSNSPTVSRGFFESVKDLSPDKQFIIIPGGESYLKMEGLKVYNLYDFLENELPQIN